MSPADDLQQVEARLSNLESAYGTKKREEIERLWASIRDEQNIDVLFRRLKEATSDRKPASRAQVHGVIDTIVANGDDVLPATPTIIVTSSEPCALVVFTAITATICD